MISGELVALGELHLRQCAETSLLSSGVEMLRSDGVHPYRAGLFFILREARNEHHISRKAQAAVISGDVKNVSQWPLVRCLAHMYGKRSADVARDVIATHRALEDGERPQ